MKRWRRHGYLALHPSGKSLRGPDPFTSLKLSCVDERLLSLGHPGNKEPRIEATRREMRRHPSAGRFEVRAGDFKAVVIENLLERFLTGRHRAPLCCDPLDRQAVCATRQQHACLLKELADGAHTHQRFLAFTTRNRDRVVFLVELPARERVIAAHELKLGTSLDPEDFWVWAVPQQYYCCRVFGCDCHAREYSTSEVRRSTCETLVDVRRSVLTSFGYCRGQPGTYNWFPMALQKFDSRKDYYRVLGVSEDASKDDLERAYRGAARKRHPDGGGSEEEMKSLNEAHDILSDSETRKAYDAERQPKRAVYGSSMAFDPEAASKAGALKIPVSDPDFAGLVIGAIACFGLGIPLLLLVEMQWVIILWPLRVMSLGALGLGVLMAHSALGVKHRKLRAQPDYPRRVLLLHELVFWLVAAAIIGSLIVLLYVA